MLMNKIEEQIIRLLKDSPKSSYSNIVKEIASYNLPYDLTPFINYLAVYPLNYAEGNPKCYTGDTQELKKKSLQLALCKIPSFYKIGFVGMNICMGMEQVDYHDAIKENFDQLFSDFWSYNTEKEKREIKDAVIIHGSISDICVPIFYFIWYNNIVDFKKYVPVALNELSALPAFGYPDHFLLKIINMLKCLKHDGRDIKDWVKLIKESFNWEVYDIEEYIDACLYYEREVAKNPTLELTEISFNYIDSLQQVVSCNIPYYLKSFYYDSLLMVLSYFSPAFDDEVNEIKRIESENKRFFIYKEVEDQYNLKHTEMQETIKRVQKHLHELEKGE